MLYKLQIFMLIHNLLQYHTFTVLLSEHNPGFKVANC